MLIAKAKTKQNELSVDAYLDAIADAERRQDCRELIEMMRGVTQCEAKMWGTGIVGFGIYHYKYVSGNESDACLTGFASRKGDISIYLMCGCAGHEALFATLGKHKMGKACLYVRRLSDVELPVLEQLIARSVAETRRRYPQCVVPGKRRISI